MSNILSSLWETIKIIIIALIIVVPIRLLIIEPFFVKGQSMEPNFSNGDYLIIEKTSYRFGVPKRGEVVVFKYPRNPSQRYIKRIIGLPNETVEIKQGEIIIFQKADNPDISPAVSFSLDESSYLPEFLTTTGETRVKLKENEFFVLGDNRPFSSDSRRWGQVEKQDIVGKVLFRLWPVPAMAKIPTPIY